MAKEIVGMSSFEYAVTHRHDPRQVSRILVEEEGFTGGSDGEYRREVDDWKDIVAKVGDDEILFSFYWPGSKVTTKYYEYLVESGRLLQRVADRLRGIDSLLDVEE